MEDVEKVADDLYFVEVPIREGWFGGVIVVLGTKPRIGLVDTGFENTPTERIFPLVERLGRRPEEIDFVVNTHRDGDHVSGNKVVKERTGANIAIHELEAEAVDTADIKLRDGDLVQLGDRTFRVIHAPGHRPGNICLYDSKNCTLITGDSVCGDRTNLIRMGKEIYVSSLRKLLGFETRLLIMSHPFKPLGKCILVGNEAKEMINGSIEIAEKLS